MTKTQRVNQRLVDEAYAHLKETECRSVDKAGLCQYGGTGCAFRPAIKTYDARMEHHSASDLIKRFPEYLHEWVLDVDPSLANEVQGCHDSAVVGEFWEMFNKYLRELCEKEELKHPEDK